MTVCARIYNNESVRRVFRFRTQAEVDSWTGFNMAFRPGCGLIVDGKIVQVGYLTEERLGAWVHLCEKYKDRPFDTDPHE